MIRDGARFEIEIRPGVFLAPELLARVVRFEIEATVDGADALQLVVHPWDEERRAWLFRAGEPLGPGSEVVAWVGYGRELVALQAFRVEHRRAPMRAGETPKLEITGYSAEARMVANETARSWSGPVSDAAIARELAEAHGLAWTPQTIPDTPTRDRGRVKEKGTTDWEFLRRLAYANGHGDPWVRWDPSSRRSVLYWRRTRLTDQEEIATFRLFPALASEASTLLSFDASYSLQGAPSAVEVLGWDAVKDEPVRVRVTMDPSGQVSLLYKGPGARQVPQKIKSGTQLQVATLQESGDGERPELLAVEGGPLQDAEAIGSWARRYLETRNRGFTTAEAETVGYERAWIGQVHRFEGVPEEFAGAYEVTAVRHRIQGGAYRCSWDLRALIEEPQIREEG